MITTKDLQICLKYEKIFRQKRTNKTELSYLKEFHKIKKIVNCEYKTEDFVVDIFIKNLNSIYYFANSIERIKLIHNFAIQLHANLGNVWTALINAYTKDATRRYYLYQCDKIELKAKYKK